MTLAREYLRVSQDRSGRERSITEQQDENHAHWSDFTWGEHFSDASSASRYADRPRDDFDWLIHELKFDRFGADVLVLWESSRGSRKVGEWVELIDLCERRGVRIAVTTHGRIYEPANPRDRRSLLEDAVDSEYESAKISDRVRRSTRSAATLRRPHGKVLFGYQRVRDTRTGVLLGQEPHPDQAPIVRWVFNRYLAGQSARSLAEALNHESGAFDKYVRTNRGNGWTALMVQRMLTNRAYLGHRMHKGEDFGQGWEPLVDVVTFEAVQRRYEAVSWRKVRRTTALCSGITRCGTCGARMEIKHSGGVARYGCPEGYHAYRRVDQLDAWVTAAVVDRLSLPDVGERLSGREDPRVNEERSLASELRAELDEAMTRWRAGQLSVQAYAKMEAHLLPQIAAAERAMRQAAAPIVVELPPAEVVPAWWDGLTPEIRREVAAVLIAAVHVQPVGRGCRTIDWRATTVIEWRR